MRDAAEARRPALLDRRATADHQVLPEPELVRLGSLDRERDTRVPSDVAQLCCSRRCAETMSSPSRPTQTIETCGLPSGLTVTRCASASDSSTARALSGRTLIRDPLIILEQAELQHPRRLEAFDPEQLARGLDGRARGHEPHQLRADDLDAAPPRLGRDPADDLAYSRAALQSVTFMLTWTRPARGRSSLSARTPGNPPSRSRIRAAISRAAATSSERRLTLNATSGRRTPTSTPPVSWMKRPARGRERAHRRRSDAGALRGRHAGRTRAPARRR